MIKEVTIRHSEVVKVLRRILQDEYGLSYTDNELKLAIVPFIRPEIILTQHSGIFYKALTDAYFECLDKSKNGNRRRS